MREYYRICLILLIIDKNICWPLETTRWGLEAMVRRSLPVLDVLWAGDPDFTGFSLEKCKRYKMTECTYAHVYTHRQNHSTNTCS